MTTHLPRLTVRTQGGQRALSSFTDCKALP
jgi:hypothetical protein